MTAPEHRYTDADVRGDDTLLELAYEYLDRYRGDFEPLVEAQEVLVRGGLLSTALARKVLNCARNDAAWAHLLPPPRPGWERGRAGGARLRVVKDPLPERPRERQWRIDLPATARWEYGCPRMRGNLHLVAAAQVQWWLPVDQFNSYRRSQVGQRYPMLEVVWRCGKSTVSPRLSPDGRDLSPKYIEACKVCFDGEEDDR